MENIVWIWLAVAVVLLIMELLSPTFIFVIFVAGALTSSAFSYFMPDEIYWQLGIFVGVAVILLPFSRMLAKKIIKESPQKSNVDALIGQIGLVIVEIDPDLGGQVKIGGETWLAEAEERIAQNLKVEIISISGTKVHVKKIESEESE